MSDFDDRARAAGERARRRADEIATSTDPNAIVAQGSTKGAARRGRLLIGAAALLVVVAGIAGLVAVTDSDPADVTDGNTVPITTDIATTTETPSTTATPASTTPTTSTTEPEPEPITRPIIDPTLCTPISAFDGRPSGLPRDPNGSLPVTLFTRGSELPVPIQVIGDPVDGQAKPFALVLRYFDRVADRSSQLDPVDINEMQVFVRTYANGNGEAEWTTSDGSVGYLRSRGLDRDEVIAIIGQLTPREADATINGFDYGADGPASLELVAERMNTAPWDGTVAGSQCVVEATGNVLRVAMFTGDPTLMYAAVIDRAPPGDIGVIGQSVIILAQLNTDGVTAGDVVDADEDTWRRLLDLPDTNYSTAILVTVGVDIDVPFVPIDSTSIPTSSLTLRIDEREGVSFLEVYKSGAVVADAAEYWKVEIDERIRGRSTAVPGPGQGVSGTRLGDAPITAPFFVQVSTTDGDDQTIQTTGLIQLVPAP